MNSINWARVVAQVVYYFKGYFAATQSNDEQVSFAVPSGNFGNIFAGHVAKRMGLPIRRLVLATNENDVLDEFFRTGRYRPAQGRRHARDLEPVHGHLQGVQLRALHLGHGRRRRRQGRVAVERRWTRRAASTFPPTRRGRRSRRIRGSSRAAARTRTASPRSALVKQKYGEVIDPHTADGVKIALRLREPRYPMICLETALPAKFDETIVEALGEHAPRPARFEGLEKLPQRVDGDEARCASAVKGFISERVVVA